MTILTLRCKDKNIRDYALVNGQELTIGRNPDNDIVIDNPAVSGYHARIESVATSFILRDLDSSNGLFVNNERTDMHVLQHNDIVLVGKHDLVFNRLVFDRSARLDKNKVSDEAFLEDETRFLDTREYKELIQQTNGKNIPISSESETQVKSDVKKGFFSKLLKKIIG